MLWISGPFQRSLIAWTIKSLWTYAGQDNELLCIYVPLHNLRTAKKKNLEDHKLQKIAAKFPAPIWWAAVIFQKLNKK